MPYDVDIGDGADALGQNQLTDALDGTYWVSGWDATLGAGDLEVDIAAGSGAVAGTDVSTGSTQTVDFTGDPDSTDPRKAVIYVDATGTVQKALGTPQPVDPSGEIRFRTYNPSPPASVSGVVVAEVWLAAGATVLESADVRDRRLSNTAAANATPNKPDWVEDPNSPISLTNQSSNSITLSGEYDVVKCFWRQEDTTNVQIWLRVNGDTGSNYFYYTTGESTTTSDDKFVIANGSTAGSNATIMLDGRFPVDFGMSCDYNGNAGAEKGTNDSIASPLTQIEILTNGSAIDGTLEVYGRNIE